MLETRDEKVTKLHQTVTNSARETGKKFGTTSATMDNVRHLQLLMDPPTELNSPCRSEAHNALFHTQKNSSAFSFMGVIQIIL